MALNAKEAPGGGASFKEMEAGSYPARIVQVVDLGLQNQRPYQGEEKPPAREILLTYEFADEFLEDEDGNDDPEKPRFLSETFPLYNLTSDKAKSTKRYNSLDPNMEFDGDFSKLIEMPCHVTVVNNPGKGKHAGKVFNNIASVSAMRAKEAAKAPPLVNQAIVFDLDNPDADQFKALPEWVRKKIAGNLEFEGSALAGMLGDGLDVDAEKAAYVKSADDEGNPY